MQLTQKETELIKDLKSQEKLCVEKFTKYSSVAKDPQLKNLFTQLAQAEQRHLNTVTEIENGGTPQMGGGSGEASGGMGGYTQADYDVQIGEYFTGFSIYKVPESVPMPYAYSTWAEVEANGDGY